MSPRGNSCGFTAACPSCRGRQAADLWSRLDRELFGGTPRRGAHAAGATMVVRLATHTFPRMTPAEWDESGWAVAEDYVDLAHLFNSRLSQGRGLTDGRRYRRRASTMQTRPTEIARFRRLYEAETLLGADRGSVAHYLLARNRRRLVAAFGDLAALRRD